MIQYEIVAREFNPFTCIVLITCFIYFRHLVLYFFSFNFLLPLLLPYELWVLWLNMCGECTSCFTFTFDWHLACPTAECIHTAGRIIEVLIAAAASQAYAFMYQPTVNYIHGHRFLILFVISFEIIFKWNIFVTLCSLLQLLVLS